jgi:hypothetical protein
MPAPSLFTPEALERWERLNPATRRTLLDVAWCGYCIGPGPLTLRAGWLKGKHLVLEGECSRCGNAMVRNVSPSGTADL